MFAFMFALAVIVIACPCVFGLAAPTAITVGTGIAARLGMKLSQAMCWMS